MLEAAALRLELDNGEVFGNGSIGGVDSGLGDDVAVTEIDMDVQRDGGI